MYLFITNTEGVHDVAQAVLELCFENGQLGGLVPLAPLATPMIIESKCMFLSQILRELWPFQ